MSFLRSLAADLRERQVLPAVLLLALLAIAIPVYATIALANSPAPVAINPAPVDVTPPHGAPPPGQELSAVETAQSQRYTVYKGQEPNPFRTAASGSATSSPSASTSTPVVKPLTTLTPTKTTTSAPAVKPKATAPKSESAPTKLSDDEAYTINAVSSYGSETDTLDDVQRLAPLPANVDGEIVYLGVAHHGERAVFLLTDTVAAKLTASSSATCLPSSSDCQVIELEPGQQLQLKPTSGSGSLATFTFKLNSIQATSYGSSSAAKSARTSVSAAGALIVSQSTSTVLSSFVYDAGTGALHYEPAAPLGTTGTTGATGATG
ncbi:MAG: hypothetical protein ABR946_06775 [Solirubrobacteraceae bacterium]